MKARLLTTLAALLLALTSWANGTEIDGIYYELDSSTKTASVTYTGKFKYSVSTINPTSTAYTGDITIPASVTYGGTTYSVTSIGRYAFYYCYGLTSITIPESVTCIEDFAFIYCTGLTSISIPASVTIIGAWAFSYCTGLTSISIPNSVTSIEDYAFCGCTGLASIDIPSSVTSIGSTAFWGCTGLTSITIPNSVTTIGDGAFYRCTWLTDIYALRTDPAAYNCSAYAFYYISVYASVSATLHVPIGSKETYAATAPWSNFQNIVEYDASGIEPLCLTPSEADAASYYNLQGQRFARPQRGQIVIQRNADGTSRKVLVK